MIVVLTLQYQEKEPANYCCGFHEQNFVLSKQKQTNVTDWKLWKVRVFPIPCKTNGQNYTTFSCYVKSKKDILTL